MSKVLWESVPNVGSKARESVKAMSFAFVFWIFSMRVSEEERSVRSVHSG